MRYKNYVLSLIVALATLWFSRSVDDRRSQPNTIPSMTSTSTIIAVTSTNALVIRVVDGDTIVARIDGESEDAHVRLLGVNTPESVDPRRAVQCFSKEASRHMEELVEGKRVRLDQDFEADDRDKYNRLLRNVVLEDGIDVNRALVHDGYAYAYVSFPMNVKRKTTLKREQEEAKRARRGLWNPETCGGRK